MLLRKDGASLEHIGLTSLLALPWALKFLWAPWVDRTSLGTLGRRKSWIVPLQLCAVVVLSLLAFIADAPTLPLLLAAVLLLNLFAATQDIATDGLAVELLAEDERGVANGLQVAGYRFGMIVGGGVLLILFARLGARAVFLVMAVLTAIATLPVMLSQEPRSAPRVGPAPKSLFFKRAGAWRILALLIVYKAGEAFATSMLRPFLSDRGLSLEDVGWLLGTVGFVAGLAGALVGGALVNRLGRRRALVTFGGLQALAVAGYASLALSSQQAFVTALVCGVEHFVSGMATAALFTCMMDWSSAETSGTDYTVQASAVVIATGAASALAGFSAARLGYAAHFWVAALLALAAVGFVNVAFPRTSTEPSCA